MGNSQEAPAVAAGLSRYDRHRLQAGLRRLAETAASTLEVARVAAWLYGGDRGRLHRIHLYHRSSGEHVAGGELRREHFPSYFEALDEGSLLAVADVHGDPRTAELSEPYAAPLGISSWIDAPIAGTAEQASTLGVLRFEHLGPSRGWSARERSVARALASSVGALLEYFDARRGSAAGGAPAEGVGELPEQVAAGPAPEETIGAPHEEPEVESAEGRPPGDGDGDREEWDGGESDREAVGLSGAPVRDDSALEDSALEDSAREKPGATRRSGRAPTTGSGEEDLAAAAADGRLALRWLPIRRASDGAQVGAEALLRLRRADGGELAPAREFVRRAEKTGAIASLDRWVLDRATARAAAWRQSGGVDWVALNVSPLSLLEEEYRSAFRKEVEQRALGPAAVLVQVALDMDRHPTVEVGRALFSLWEAGFGICLDPVGAADELLEIALAGLPADVLEVTPEMLERWEARGLPAGVREARRSRELRLLAKKLETSDQERRARALECEFLSGRVVGPPVAADEIMEVTGAGRTRWAGRPGRDGS